MSDEIAAQLARAAEAVRAAEAAYRDSLVARAVTVGEARVAGWTVRAIAAEMGLPPASVQADLHRIPPPGDDEK